MRFDLPTLYRAFERRAEIEALMARVEEMMAPIRKLVGPVADLARDGRNLVEEISPGIFGPPDTLFDAPKFDVKWLQSSLNSVMHWSLPVDGEYGPRTHDAVRGFQAMNGLVVDGWAGVTTCMNLFSQTRQK